jgi:fructose 1,6-bisphosphate aldolase/phosphatase
MRRHGPFQPHRLSEAEMEYSSMPVVLDRIKNRFKKL